MSLNWRDEDVLLSLFSWCSFSPSFFSSLEFSLFSLLFFVALFSASLSFLPSSSFSPLLFLCFSFFGRKKRLLNWLHSCISSLLPHLLRSQTLASRDAIQSRTYTLSIEFEAEGTWEHLVRKKGMKRREKEEQNLRRCMNLPEGVKAHEKCMALRIFLWREKDREWEKRPKSSRREIKRQNKKQMKKTKTVKEKQEVKGWVERCSIGFVWE